jgi:hypothetical protein
MTVTSLVHTSLVHFNSLFVLVIFKQVLAVSRVMVAWQPIGISMGIYDMCHRYVVS